MNHAIHNARPILGLIILSFGYLVSSPSFGQESTPSRLRVLTYNIHHGRGTDGRVDLERLARIIAELKPDIVALQEVDNKTERSSGIDQAARLSELVEMKHAFGNAMYFSSGQYGVAILSRFPLEQIKNHPLPYDFGQESRTVLTTRVRTDHGLPDFIFADTHLCHNNAETRLQQTQQLDRLLRQTDGLPIILAGDLNARPDSDAMKVLLEERWIDAIAPQSRIDYVLYCQNDPWKVVDVIIFDDQVASDHRPVLAILEWNGESAKSGD